MSFVSCLPGITVFHYLLSKIFSAVVSYILLGSYYFMKKAKSGPFYSILTGTGIIVVLFCILIMTSYIEHILICLLTIHVFLLRVFVKTFTSLSSRVFSFLILFVHLFIYLFFEFEMVFICPGYTCPLLDK